MKLPKVLTSTLVIALTLIVISSVQCTSISIERAEAAAARPDQVAQVPAGAAPSGELKPLEAAGLSAKALEPTPSGKSDEASSAAKKVSSEPAASEQEASSRRGRSEPPSSAATEKPAPASEKEATKLADEKKPATGAKQTAATATSKPAAGAAASKLAGKSGAPSGSNKKLPANLGTVTSTGSGGPAHYMSKHDAYSAIAEKHGALAQDAIRKVDKRQQSHLQQRFGGSIQKASGIGDLMNPFKGVTDSGLARTLGASVRSIMKSKYSVPAYLASAVLGAVALMAFYESPISPLPVPPLPEPPVGRFPPEMPNISPNAQVPFRLNGQQQNQGRYGQSYQRSFQTQQQQQPMPGQQQQQQVLFPGSAPAQQRQMSPVGPVQQLAANLISSVGANRQTAQRKSSPDYDPATSRSFFGSAGQQQQQAGAKLGAPANSQLSLQPHQQHKTGAASSILSFLGLGGSEGSASTSGQATSAGVQALSSLDIHRASGLSGHQIAAGGGPIASASGTEQKGQAALSNSHLVNKMKSYFDRPIVHNIWPVEQYAPNQYDQYRRMSIVQALAKDTAFLSSFFSPSRRSSNATSQIQQSIGNVLAAATGTPSSSSSSSSSPSQVQAANVQQQQQQQAAAAVRMQADQPLLSSYLPLAQPLQQQQQQYQPAAPIANTKRASSGYGLMRAADRIGHALLETFTSGLLHRSSQAQVDSAAARKSEEEQQQQQNALASATSLLSDIMSSYSAQQAAGEQQAKQQQQHQARSVSEATSVKSPSQTSSSSRSASESAQGRSAEQSPAVAAAQAEQQVSSTQPKSAAHEAAGQPESSGASAVGASATGSSSAQPAPLVRKTRSIGLEYSFEPSVPLPPSRASQINSLVDMVSDSYKQNRLLFSFVMNQVGLSHALPYVDQFLGTPNEPKDLQV